MIEFKKIISASEVKTTYLNLTDNEKNTYGSSFPQGGTPLLILDENENEFHATKHGNNQIWGNIRQWFNEKNIEPGTYVKISYNILEKKGGKPVVHIEVLNHQSIIQGVTDKESEEIDQITEISFEFEKQLEQFLSDNLSSIENGLKIYVDNNENAGRQFPTDVGIIDLLCVDKDNNFVVIELKKKRTSDVVVGQILRYMGWIKENLNQSNSIRGIVITPELDERLEYAASMVSNIEVKYYKINIEFISKGNLGN